MAIIEARIKKSSIRLVVADDGDDSISCQRTYECSHTHSESKTKHKPKPSAKREGATSIMGTKD